MIILDVIIIILQLINLYFTFKIYMHLRSIEESFDSFYEALWSITVDIGKIKNKIREFENELSI